MKQHCEEKEHLSVTNCHDTTTQKPFVNKSLPHSSSSGSICHTDTSISTTANSCSISSATNQIRPHSFRILETHAAVLNNIGAHLIEQGELLNAFKVLQSSVQVLMFIENTSSSGDELKEGETRNNHLSEILPSLNDMKASRQCLQRLVKRSKQSVSNSNSNTCNIVAEQSNDCFNYDCRQIGIPGLFSNLSKIRKVNSTTSSTSPQATTLIFPDPFHVIFTATAAQNDYFLGEQLQSLSSSSSYSSCVSQCPMSHCSKAALFNMGLIHYAWGSIDSAIHFFDLSISLGASLKPSDEPDLLFMACCNNIGQLRLQSDKSTEARKRFFNAWNHGEQYLLKDIYFNSKTAAAETLLKIQARETPLLPSTHTQSSSSSFTSTLNPSKDCQTHPTSSSSTSGSKDVSAIPMESNCSPPLLTNPCTSSNASAANASMPCHYPKSKYDNKSNAKTTPSSLHIALARTLMNLAHVHYYHCDYDGSKRTCKDAFQLLHPKIPHHEAAALAYNFGLLYHHRNKRIQALEQLDVFLHKANQLLDQKVRHSSTTNDKIPLRIQISTALLRKGIIYFEMGDLYRSMKPLMQSFEIRSTQIGTNPQQNLQLAESLFLMAKVLQEREEYESAYKVLRKCHSTHRSISKVQGYEESSLEEAHTLLEIGRICHARGNIQESLDAYLSVLQCTGRFFGRRHQHVARMEIIVGNLYLEQGKVSDATKHFIEATRINIEHGLPIDFAFLQNRLFRVTLTTHNYRGAASA